MIPEHVSNHQGLFTAWREYMKADAARYFSAASCAALRATLRSEQQWEMAATKYDLAFRRRES
jgi:hypothetical protein